MAASIGGLFHFKPSVRCPLLAQSGHRTVRRTATIVPRTYVRGSFFLSFRAYIHCAWTLWSRISAPVAASINTAMKGAVSEETRRKGDIVKNSKEALKKQADARFKKDERVREGTKAMLEYEAEGRAVREKTARLRALRLDKEAAEKNEGVAADSGQPLAARKK